MEGAADAAHAISYSKLAGQRWCRHYWGRLNGLAIAKRWHAHFPNERIVLLDSNEEASWRVTTLSLSWPTT